MNKYGFLFGFIALSLIAGCAHKTPVQPKPPEMKQLLMDSAAGNLKAVQKYAGKGYDLDARNELGTTAAMIAAKNGRLEILDFLKSKGANLSWSDNEGDNVMTFAMIGGQAATVRHLITLGVSPDIKVLRSFTPLLLATHQNQMPIIQILIENKADVNAQDLDGNTALHLAVEKKSMELMESLLKAGARMDILNQDKQTPLDLAKAEKNTEAAKLLRDEAAARP